MEQEPLFYEDLNGALAHVVSALGGPKVVGNGLWPSMPVDKAGRKVTDCLRETHAQRFTFDDLIWLLAEARKQGIHSAMAHINEIVGYAAPVPVEPEDEAAQLKREFNKSVKLQGQILKRLERIAGAA